MKKIPSQGKLDAIDGCIYDIGIYKVASAVSEKVTMQIQESYTLSAC